MEYYRLTSPPVHGCITFYVKTQYIYHRLKQKSPNPNQMTSREENVEFSLLAILQTQVMSFFLEKVPRLPK